MGNKCRFCVTCYGNVKRVAGVLQGSGCGCGRCSGQWADRAELERAVNYYESELKTLDMHEGYLRDYRNSIEEQITLLRNINPVK